MIRIEVSGDFDEAAAALIGTLCDPDEFFYNWSSEVARRAQGNARNHAGSGGFWGAIAKHVDFTSSASGGEVWCDHPVARHKHEGGTIRAKNGKNLAIPIHEEVRRSKEWPSDRSDIFAVPVGTRTFLARETADRKNLEFLYVLKPEVYQRPEPWWPDDDTVMEIGFDEASAMIEEATR